MTGDAPPPPRNFLAEVPPASPLIGFQRSLDDELRLLIGRYGVIAVRDAARRLTKGKKGRKPEKDWPGLKEAITRDALEWLDGIDPVAIRSNYFLANEFADQHPGHNRTSTQRRIMRKLARLRRWFILVTAWEISEASRPFADYFRAAEALAELDPRLGVSVMAIADTKRGTLERYRTAFGGPDPAMTIHDIDERMQSGTLNALLDAGSLPRRGMFGTRRW